MCADRFGRCALLLVTVGGSRSPARRPHSCTKEGFTIWSDRRPPVPDDPIRPAVISERGTAAAARHRHYDPDGVRTVGTVVMAKGRRFSLLLADAPGNAAHDFAMDCVASVHRC
jgi:hypothetical protein